MLVSGRVYTYFILVKSRVFLQAVNRYQVIESSLQIADRWRSPATQTSKFRVTCSLTIQKKGSAYTLGCPPRPVTVTTRIITRVVGNPFKSSFATVTGRGDNPTYTP